MAPHSLQPIRYDAGKLVRLIAAPRLTPMAQAIAATLEWLRMPPS